MRKLALMLLSLACFSSCASVIEGTHQEVMVNTSPADAKCQLVREGITIGTIDKTPGSVVIEKDKNPITIKCNKPGYEETTYIDKSDVAGATVGNVLAGGLIGWGVDSATGADNKYESPVNITLSPKAGHHAKKAKKAKKTEAEEK